MKRTPKLYLLIVSVVGFGIFFILHVGSQLLTPAFRFSTVATPNTAHPNGVGGSPFLASVKSNFWQSATSPLSRLFLQLFIVISASGVVAWLFAHHA
jgi:hypothetical protein